MSIGAGTRLCPLVSPMGSSLGEVRAALRPQDPQVRSVAIVLANAYLQGAADHEAQTLMEAVLAQGDLDGSGGATPTASASIPAWAGPRCGKTWRRRSPLLQALILPETSPIRPHLPESIDPYYNLGYAYGHAGRWAKARAVMTEDLARPGLRPVYIRDGILVNLSGL